MKKIIYFGLIGSMISISCSGVSNAKTAQNNRAEFLKMKGDWQISSVNYDKDFKIKPFDEGADAQCFVGSVWHLVPNNYTGSYSLNGGGTCPTITTSIKFEVVDGNTFRFKKIAEGTKAKQNEVGYQVTLLNQTADSFSLQQNVPFEGEMVTIVYNFIRTGK